MSTVDTVLGSVPLDQLGPTLIHEHLIMISAEFQKFYPELAWSMPREEVVNTVAAALQEVRDRGITTILDCTAFFHGRDMDFVKEVNDRVDINIIVSSGIYAFDYLPYHLSYRVPKTVEDDILTRMFVRDITIGVGDSGVKAQSIKVATDLPGITDNNERILRAAACASAQTGAPITVHTHPADQLGPRIQKILAEQGADLSKVVVAHSGDSTDLDYLRSLMDAGSMAGFDRFGLYMPGTSTMQERLDTVATLCKQGYADRIGLSHDAVLYSDWGPPGMAAKRFPTWVPTHISDVIVPALRERGVAEADIDTMTVSAPGALFAGIRR
ncbi:phosphotriesterase family protein [Nocardia bovistercoris]|uniref:Phosphotriesterase-related protein n=1 Tax=Nocardia bovistercoris TaxID=2785916 RepID=A0A931N5I3_9NOCA|nr:phosphotriesterase-related protein [Nocardia bovistercoris]MBH0779752.1 phosphotriesterase-related protein [Nocardia bovistercoris]